MARTETCTCSGLLKEGRRQGSRIEGWCIRLARDEADVDADPLAHITVGVERNIRTRPRIAGPNVASRRVLRNAASGDREGESGDGKECVDQAYTRHRISVERGAGRGGGQCSTTEANEERSGTSPRRLERYRYDTYIGQIVSRYGVNASASLIESDDVETGGGHVGRIGVVAVVALCNGVVGVDHAPDRHGGARREGVDRDG